MVPLDACVGDTLRVMGPPTSVHCRADTVVQDLRDQPPYLIDRMLIPALPPPWQDVESPLVSFEDKEVFISWGEELPPSLEIIIGPAS